MIVGSIVALLVAAIVVPRILTGRADRAFGNLARSAGCGDIQDTGRSGAGDHLGQAERTTYDSVPPAHGPHAGTTVPAGVYEEPLSEDPNADLTIYEAVHSLEHGAVVVWYDGLKKAEVDQLDRTYSGEEKVIVTPYPPLRGDDLVAMTAWGRLVKCEELSTAVIDAFIERFREARTAPEPKNAI